MKRCLYALALAMSAAGCSEDHGRGDDAAMADAGPRMLEERCQLAWSHEIAVPDMGLGIPGDVTVATVDGRERVLVFLSVGAPDPTDASQALGLFDAETGAGSLVPTPLVALASSHDRVFAVARDDWLSTHHRLVEIDPRDGRELRTLGTFEADAIQNLEVVALTGRVIASFRVFEQFGLDAPMPQARGSQVLLSASDALEVLSLGTFGALIEQPEGAVLISAPDRQLCFDGVCRDAPGSIHTIGAAGTVESQGGLDGFRARTVAGLPDGSIAALDDVGDVFSFGPDHRARVASIRVPADYNVLEGFADHARTRFLTHTRSMGEPAALTDGWSLPARSPDENALLVVWALPSLTPLHFTSISVVAPMENFRSGIGQARLGDGDRIVATFLADPALDVCGHHFERSVGIVALD